MKKLTTDGRLRVDEWGRVHDFGEPRNMTLAAYASTRTMTCTHEHTPYRAIGGMPCTGPRVCTMCGAVGVVIGEAC